jgi:S1-C subfamily serine protease
MLLRVTIDGVFKMRKLITFALVYISLLNIGVAGEIHDKMRSSAVTVFAQGANGSGVIRHTKMGTFCLTAGHVVAHARKTTTTTNQNGQVQTTYTGEFSPVTIARHRYLGGLKFGVKKTTASVVKYSSYEEDDLAILKVDDNTFDDDSIEWAKNRVKIGDSVWACTSPHGWSNSNCLNFGEVTSQTKDFDIMSAMTFEGSSGGNILDEQGRYVGMITRRSTGSLTEGWVIPVTKIKKFAEKNQMGFLFED